jgi:hypothetical protein
MIPLRQNIKSVCLLISLVCLFAFGEIAGLGHTHPEKTSLVLTKMDLWDLRNGPHLRGANIYQRRVYRELDGPNFAGSGSVGPPYNQEDLNRLAAVGANYVNISHPGLFTETSPYILDEEIQSNLDNLLNMITKADMFAVICFRTGPGRSEFTFHQDDVGTWFDASYLNDKVWVTQAAQDAWVDMWRHTASRYQNNPIVVGYDLMVEPNANDTFFDLWEPEDFYARYSGTLYDWNPFFPKIIAGIRAVDADTPILVGGMSYSSVEWMPYIQTASDSHTVYLVHQYAPFDYTHQEPPLKITYPGMLDTDWDGNPDPFNRSWLRSLLTKIDQFASSHSVSTAVNEFGLMRWQPGAAQFMQDQMDILEEFGINHALWIWETSWPPYVQDVDAFNFRHGPDPNNHSEVDSSQLMNVIYSCWQRNTARPSNSRVVPGKAKKVVKPRR